MVQITTGDLTGTNVTGKSHPLIRRERPRNHKEVIDLVAWARETKTPLYPISTGLNWGYGSSSPASPDCVLVDLSLLNRILNEDQISQDNPIAVIEPGVTQGQLYDFLQSRCPALTFNVTGSARDTSIVGNSLDRGVGYFGPRKEDLFGLVAVCGSGEVVKTGFRRLGEDSPLAHCHPFGLGPMLDGLFFQGNFGIVTSACFRLTPRRPREVAISLALKDRTQLGRFIGELAKLKREGLMTSVSHVANKARSQSSLLYGITRYLEEICHLSPSAALLEAERVLDIVAPNEWTSLGAITGNANQVAVAISEIKSRVKSYARVLVVTKQKLKIGFLLANALRFIPRARNFAAAIAAIKPLNALALGVPTDVAIENLLWKFGSNDMSASRLDESSCGLLFISCALPSEGQFVAKLIDEFNAIAAQHQHQLYTTINIETATSLVAIINLLFDRTSEAQVIQAHQCASALLAYIHERRLEVYRCRVDMMQEIVSRDPEYWSMVHRLKLTLDPANIIAPGRYNPVNQ